MTHAVKVTLDLPDEVKEENRVTAEQKAHEAAVLALWESAEISTREAASELGLAYHAFLDLLSEKGIPVERGVFDADAVKAAGTLAGGKT